MKLSRAITEGHQPLLAAAAQMFDLSDFAQHRPLLLRQQGPHGQKMTAVLITTGQVEKHILHPPDIHALQTLHQCRTHPAQG